MCSRGVILIKIMLNSILRAFLKLRELLVALAIIRKFWSGMYGGGINICKRKNTRIPIIKNTVLYS